MNNPKSFSIIIPHRGDTRLLAKLVSSIPDFNDIEVIIVDNTPLPISKKDICANRDFDLFWSDPKRHAGGARNVGIEQAHGKWLIFADSDDYFTQNAFDVFYKYLQSDADIIYFKAEGIYADTGEWSDRASGYTKLVERFCENPATEMDLRLNYSVPWAKMLKTEFVNNGSFKYDEIRAGNDIYFSTITGYHAKKIEVCNEIVYMVTVTKGSLTKRKDYEVIKARLYSKLHCNQFLREKGLAHLQYSVMFAIPKSFRFGLRVFFEFLYMIAKFKQNPFVKCGNWLKTTKKNRIINSKEKKYIVK